MSEYYLKARLMPTVITMIPMVTLYIRLINPLVGEVLEPVWDILPLLTGVSINVALMFLLVSINRFFSKIIFQKIFYQDDLKMPTTDYLLPDNKDLDKASRNRYYDLILKDFGIEMKKDLKSLKTEQERRIMIARVVGQIRELLRNNKMLLQHNIEYGFFRNLVGGSVLACVFSIALIIASFLQCNEMMKVTSIIMLVVYLLPIVFSKPLIKYHGRNYANVLFDQYGSINRLHDNITQPKSE